jgi:hypothetical protein
MKIKKEMMKTKRMNKEKIKDNNYEKTIRQMSKLFFLNNIVNCNRTRMRYIENEDMKEYDKLFIEVII